jgi:hypothetical protein
MFDNLTWPMACVYNIKNCDKGSKCGGAAEVSHGKFIEAVENLVWDVEEFERTREKVSTS